MQAPNMLNSDCKTTRVAQFSLKKDVILEIILRIEMDPNNNIVQ